VLGLCAGVGVVLAGCGESSGPARVDYVDASITRFHPLGWLGGRAHPASQLIEIDDPDKPGRTIAPGGMVVRELIDGAPLAAAGAKAGDVIVRVGESWLPNKEDPSLDLLALIEQAISEGAEDVPIGVLRNGALASIPLPLDRPALEIGLPADVRRFRMAVEAGLDRLAAQQSEDGSFTGATPGPSTDLAVTALAGVAFLAGGSTTDEGRHAEAVARCEAWVTAAVAETGTDPGEFDTWGLSFALMFLAELAADSAPTISMTAMPPGAVMFGGDALPAGAMPSGVITRSMPSPDDAEATVTRTLVPAKDEIPDDVLERIAAGDGAERVITFGGEGEGPPPDVLKHAMANSWNPGGPEALERLMLMGRVAAALVALQNEDGGWPTGEPEPVGYTEATLATNQALLAIGMAERVGLAIEPEVVARGCAFLKVHTNDGRVYAVDVPGFDRRREAGRSGGAAAALNALNCLETDEFLTALIEYNGDHGREIPGGGTAIPLHVLNTALLRRQLGGGAWNMFYQEFRFLIVAMQDPDGSFAASPADPARHLDLERRCAGEAFRTAIWCTIAALQSEHLPVALCRQTTPMQVAMNSDGERVGRPAAGPGMPGGVMTFEADSIEDLQKMLEDMGVDSDNIQIFRGPGGAPPPDDDEDG
jgi:hypothetical protein